MGGRGRDGEHSKPSELLWHLGSGGGWFERRQLQQAATISGLWALWEPTAEASHRMGLRSAAGGLVATPGWLLLSAFWVPSPTRAGKAKEMARARFRPAVFRGSFQSRKVWSVSGGGEQFEHTNREQTERSPLPSSDFRCQGDISLKEASDPAGVLGGGGMAQEGWAARGKARVRNERWEEKGGSGSSFLKIPNCTQHPVSPIMSIKMCSGP